MNIKRTASGIEAQSLRTDQKNAKLKAQLKAVRQKQNSRPPAKPPKDYFAESQFGAKTLTKSPAVKPQKHTSEREPRRWTVLAYLAGDCNLEEYAVEDLLNLQKAGSTPDMNIIVQIDRGADDPDKGKGDNRLGAGMLIAGEESRSGKKAEPSTPESRHKKQTEIKAKFRAEKEARLSEKKARVEKEQKNPSIARYGGRPGATRYYVTKWQDSKIHSQELQHLGRTDMSDPRVLKDFLSWGFREFPAENYMVVMLGHGGGVMGLITDEGGAKDFPKKDDIISPPDLKKAFQLAEEEAGVSKDQVLIGMKSCQMGQAEVLSELQDAAAMLLASQSVVNTDHWRMNELFGKEGVADLNLRQMADHIFAVNQTDLINPNKLPLNPAFKNQIPQSAIVRPRISTGGEFDLSQMPKLEKSLGKLTEALKKTSTPPEKLRDILELKSRPGYFVNSWIVNYASDFYTAAREMVKDPEIKDPELKKAAREVLSSLDKVVLQSTHNSDIAFKKNSLGLGITTASRRKIYEKFSGLPAGKTAAYEDSAYHRLKLDRETGWSDMLTFSKGTTMEKLDETLPDAVFAYPHWKEFSRQAGEDLALLGKLEAKDLQGKDAEKVQKLKTQLEKTKKELKRIKDNPGWTSLVKDEKIDRLLNGLGPISRLRRLNGHVMVKSQREMMHAVLNRIVMRSDMTGELAEIMKTGNAVISALDGEISTATLARAAQNVLENGKTAKNRETNAAVGAELITIFGYGTQNRRMMNVRNYHGEKPQDFLKNLAALKTSAGS